jgi:hypothetical protein
MAAKIAIIRNGLPGQAVVSHVVVARRRESVASSPQARKEVQVAIQAKPWLRCTLATRSLAQAYALM